MSQFLQITDDYTLGELSDRVGDRNVQYFLATNNLQRSPDIGQAFSKRVQNIYETTAETDWKRKSAILNKFVDDSDIFEEAALMDEDSWKVMSQLGTFPDMLRVPEAITLPDASDVLGNGTAIGKEVYRQTMVSLSTYPHTVNPEIFNTYSVIKSVMVDGSTSPGSIFNNVFPIPWGDITIYSQLSGESMDIPVYPDEYEDGRQATYQDMDSILYQYEPWKIYTGSGPRSNTINFGTMHRDMWSGDHADGSANKLIRFFESMCYPDYNGSAVNSDIATLYVKGNILISGIITEVSVKWSGPILQDGWYAAFELSVTFVEISTRPLSRSVVKSLDVIS